MTGDEQAAGLAVLGSTCDPSETLTVHAVMGWAGSETVLVPCGPAPGAAVSRLVGPAAVVQLRLDLGDPPVPTSSGLTWATWALPSIPTDVRGLRLADAAAAVAAGMAAVAA